MIQKEVFTKEHIEDMQSKTVRDPILIERTVFAFGLLDALATVDLPFIFKGGTSLLLLLDNPRRLSTDIDIIVKPKTDIIAYIEKAAKIFPFIKVEEQTRNGKNDIVKQHFKFTYLSPTKQSEFYILMDVVYEENLYGVLERHKIQSDALGIYSNMSVTTPSADSLLGDKLTAFAPHTVGIKINEGKDMEIIKQMYDVSALLENLRDFKTVKSSYDNVVKTESAYRGNAYGRIDALHDTFWASASIASRGKIEAADYKYYLAGMRALRNHIFYETFTPEVAAVRAPHIMYLVSCLMTDSPYIKTENPSVYSSKIIHNKKLNLFNYLKKIDSVAYSYIIKTDELLDL